MSLSNNIFNFARNTAEKYLRKDMINYKLLERQAFFRRSSKKELQRLRNKFEGQRCFIVGNGPSLNKCDLELLENEFSFAVNGIFYKTKEMGFKPTFYVVEDYHVMHDNLEEIKAYDTQYRFFPTNYKHLFGCVEKNTLFFNMNTGYYQETSPNHGIPRFSADCSEQVFCGQSVTMMNLQLAHYLGFKDVYLIGMDFSYKIPDSAEVDRTVITSTEDDENHFHPDYFGKGKKWHDPQLDKVLNSYKLMKLIYESSGKNIYNATVGGKLDVFTRVDYDSLFNK